MIRFLFRSLGFFALAAAFLMVVYDGMKSIVDSRLTITSVRGLWELLNAASLQSLRPLIEDRLGPYAWDPVFAATAVGSLSQGRGEESIAALLLRRECRRRLEHLY
jgi:hypothetical protein